MHFAGVRAIRVAALMVAVAASEGASLALVVPLIGMMTGRGTLAHVGAFIALPQMIRLATLLALFVIAIAMRAMMSAWRDNALQALQLGFVDQQRRGIVDALASARWREIAGLRHARITHALGSEVPRMGMAVQLLLTIAIALVMLCVQWLLVLILAPSMALIGLAFAAMALAAARPALGRANRLGHAVQRGNLAILDTIGQLMGGLKLALAQNMQAAFVNQFDVTVRDLETRQRDFIRRRGRVRIAGTIGAALAIALALLTGTWLAIPLGRLIASLAVFTRMFGPSMMAFNAAQQLAGLLPSHAGLVALESELRAAGQGVAESSAQPPRGPITFEHVGFSYASDAAGGIDDITVSIAPGEMIGVTGPSGAGKTSFVDLLCGLIEPDRGLIRISGVALDAASRANWRDRIAYVAQDSYLFHDSIRRNLAWGRPTITEEAIWAALELADAATLVRAMPDGLETVVAERGSRLSGGERQRLALARAVLREPEMLILDEATNAIDIPTERLILTRIAALTPRPLVVMVTHRPEALEVCDRILRFEDRRLVEDVINANRCPSSSS